MCVRHEERGIHKQCSYEVCINEVRVEGVCCIVTAVKIRKRSWIYKATMGVSM